MAPAPGPAPAPPRPAPQAQVRGGAHALPGDALPLVLLLLLLQDELDEQLLQLLVAVVDAELLEAGGGRPVSAHPPLAAGFTPCAVRAARQPRPQKPICPLAPGPQGPHRGVPPATQASPLPQLVYPWKGEVSRGLASLGSTGRVIPLRQLGTGAWGQGPARTDTRHPASWPSQAPRDRGGPRGWRTELREWWLPTHLLTGNTSKP